MINLINSEDSCDKILQNCEWQSLCCHIFKTSLPAKKLPTVYEAIRLIAKLGRKGDKKPGWRGWQKLSLIAEFWESLTRDTCG